MNDLDRNDWFLFILIPLLLCFDPHTNYRPEEKKRPL
jgi:hypothetical protein